MQIVEIVLFSHDGRRRILPLNAGAVSIITGVSKTGKSALIDIVDYCFGVGHCRVPEGPVRRSVSWFGLRLQLDRGQAFVARRCPDGKAAASEDCFVEIGETVLAPEMSALRQTTNTKGLGALLTGWSGILDNVHEPPLGQSRRALAANVRHALPLCFQPQDEIGQRRQLFHSAGDSFAAQALKDTLPYFLGAVDDDDVRKREELRRLREQQRSCQRQLAELRGLVGEGTSRATSLLAQARDVGLSNAVATAWDETVAALRSVAVTPFGTSEVELPDGQEYSRLSEERDRLRDEQRRLRDEISVARVFERDEKGFTGEASEQRARLLSIGIFEDSEPGHACPLCSQELPSTTTVPGVLEIKETLTEVSSRLEAVIRAAPQVEKAIGEFETRLQRNQAALDRNRAEMEAVKTSSDRFQRIQDDMSKRAHIAGRVSLYLESLPDLPDTRALEEQEGRLRDQIVRLEEELSDERVKERIESIMSILSHRITDAAQELVLEHSKFPLRIDIGKLTIVADTAVGPVPMDRMGAGENWVGYHLIGHLALHEWFVERKRPVPRFLFLDQPSQVYFPPEKDVDGSMASVAEDDRQAVSRMFRLVFDVVARLAPGFQVVVTEHADINEKWYQHAIVERWRGGLKLIPDDWPRAGGAEP